MAVARLVLASLAAVLCAAAAPYVRAASARALRSIVEWNAEKEP